MVRRSLLRLLTCLVLILPISASAEKAPAFQLPTGKSSVSLNAFKGKVVYVDFWASWCDPCRKSFPWMTELQKRYPNDLKVIAINLDQDREEAIKFLKQNRPGFTVAFDPAGKTAVAYNVAGMPSSYLIDRSGRITSRHTGFRNKDKQDVEAKIRALISAK